ncbi:hypothetical protein NIES2107_72270 (plasmid) [Nostoc carneum NIES-2107]|nr:hypothetical protein NIES2107_72270 [Nostoc carneum NIES-2107]
MLQEFFLWGGHLAHPTIMGYFLFGSPLDKLLGEF